MNYKSRKKKIQGNSLEDSLNKSAGTEALKHFCVRAEQVCFLGFLSLSVPAA